MQDVTNKPDEFDRDDMDAADALFALAHQDGRNVSRKLATGALSPQALCFYFSRTLHRMLGSRLFLTRRSLSRHRF